MVLGESRKRHDFRPDSCPTTRRLVTARAAFPHNRRWTMGNRIAPEHVDVIRTLARSRGWSKQKTKSIRGQVIAMATAEEREQYLWALIRSRK